MYVFHKDLLLLQEKCGGVNRKERVSGMLAKCTLDVLEWSDTY